MTASGPIATALENRMHETMKVGERSAKRASTKASAASRPPKETSLVPEFWQLPEEPYHPRRPLESAMSRFEKGSALRKQTPREAHGVWKPPSERPDPVGILLEGNRGRQ